jgi:hypothetical protein
VLPVSYCGPPSGASTARDRRLRATRRLLELHERAAGGCACGWQAPPLLAGRFAYIDHVARCILAGS